MAYSKKYIREKIYEFMKSTIDESTIGEPTMADLVELGKHIESRHVSGFNADGLVWKNDDENHCTRGMNMATVRRVAAIMRLTCSLLNIDSISDFKRKTNRRHAYTSYGLKHSLEHMRKKKGDDIVYVSNGEFIGGYLYFLKNVMGATHAQFKYFMWPQFDCHGLNLFMKVPKGFDIIDDYCRGLL